MSAARRARVAGVLLAAGCVLTPPPSVPPPTPGDGVARDVEYLAGPALEGRATGSAGNDSAAEFLARRYRALGLEGAFAESCTAASACTPSYFQPFELEGTRARNVGALLPGSDPLLRTQVVVVGAHYDHVGRSGYGTMDQEMSGLVHPGADDNASGTAGVLELARRLAAHPARRSVLFVNFGAEELGLLGSRYLVEHPSVPLDSVVVMVNLDMVGRMRGNTVIVQGVGDPALRALLDSAAAATAGVRLSVSRWSDGRSDHASFAARGVPALHFFTGYHVDYHQVGDTPARINVAGLERVVELVERLTRAIADRPERLARPPRGGRK